MARRPVLAQIRGRARTQAPPVPVPAGPRLGAEPPDLGSRAPALPEDVLKDLDPDERNNVRVYNAANKSVVNITTETEVPGFFGDETSTGTGSGFVIDKQGHVLTNFHVDPRRRRQPGLGPGHALRRLGARGQDRRRRCDQ